MTPNPNSPASMGDKARELPPLSNDLLDAIDERAIEMVKSYARECIALASLPQEPVSDRKYVLDKPNLKEQSSAIPEQDHGRTDSEPAAISRP